MAAYAALLSLAQTTHPNKTDQDESLFSSEAKEGVRSIHDYVNFLLSFFEDCPDKVNRWENRIRDVAYKIEDIIEVFTWQQIQSRHIVTKPSRVKLEEQLKNVMEEIGLIVGEVMEERPANTPASSSSSSRLATVSNDVVIGLHEDIIAIKERLCGHSSDLQVIPIVGMGGIGKTTLARTVYDDQFIMSHFDICAWVVVSQDYSPHRFKKILSDSFKLLEEQMSGDEMDDSEIELKVFQYLKRRRYLVVIDDVWETRVWDDVRYMFPDDNNGSRIMLTTRQLDVAAYYDFASHVHEMRFMNVSQSWDLLRQKVFTDGYCPPELEDIGKDIARRCAGLPLAVVLAAGVLSPVNKSRASWEKIAKNVNPVVGRELEEILTLSYTYLPHHLRLCFLFVGGFLQDVNIHTSRLIRLWVAEGFIKHQNGCKKSLEEEAEEYLEDLVKRNLVIVSSRKSDGKIKSCSLHDMVRNMCIRKAHDEEFLNVMDGRDLPQGLMNERRISFSRSDVDNIWGPTFRTILCFQNQNFSSWLALLGSYKLLRVLDALGVELKELPSQVFELYHLRYLALMGSFNIPSDVSNLVNLQTLIIHLSFENLRRRHDDYVPHFLPFEIWMLPQLRHLFFHSHCMLPPPLIGLNLPLENLQTLSVVADLVWDEMIVQMIPNVKRLGLTYTMNHVYSLHHLKDLHQLEKLEVIGYGGFSWKRQNPSFPCTLKKLTLVGGGFPWKDMSIVGSLPNLEILKLLGNACDGGKWKTIDGDFPRLRFLLIDGSHLHKWITQSNPLPTLKHLVLRCCCYLWEIPEGIGEIPTLELIKVEFCTTSLVESAKKIKEEQESFGNDALQVVCASHEEIQLCYKRMDLSRKLGDQLHGLIFGRIMEEEHGYLPATTGNDAMIGLDNDIRSIMRWLCGKSSNLQVLPIVGMDGIGKTSLVRTLYDAQLIIERFDMRAWVVASKDYSPRKFKKILLDLMKLLGEQVSVDEISQSDIVLRVHRNLKGRRYLVVFDDVWGTSFWDYVKDMFPNDNNGSRILFTTTQLEANYPFPARHVHHMRRMKWSQSWDFLKQKVFTNGYCPPNMEDVGKDIAQSCGGIPLAIVLVAGVLSTVNPTQAFWKKIARDVKPVVEEWGLNLKEILDLSYSYLPHYLRPCFLSLGGFVEDAKIRASTLIELWVAEGFLKHEDGCSKSVEEEAEEYLEDLVKRNLVTVTSRKSNGKIKSCKLHDLVRDLCIRKAHEDEFVHGRDLSSLDG